MNVLITGTHGFFGGERCRLLPRDGVPASGLQPVHDAAPLHRLRAACLHDRPTRVAHFDQPAFAWT